MVRRITTGPVLLGVYGTMPFLMLSGSRQSGANRFRRSPVFVRYATTPLYTC